MASFYFFCAGVVLGVIIGHARVLERRS